MRNSPLNLVVLLSFYFIAATVSGVTRDSINVADFGAKPGSRENAVRAVQCALDECRNHSNPVLVFPEGRYDFWPQYAIEKIYYESNTTDVNPKRLAILISHFENLTIEGSGSEFIFHDRIQPFTVDSSRNIIIRNLKMDWDIPLTAEAEVVDTCKTFIDLKLDPCESPFQIENGKLIFSGEGWKSKWWGAMEFERHSKMVAYRTGDQGCLGEGWQEYRAEDKGDGLIRLHHHFTRRPGKGNYLVLRHSERDHAGIFMTSSEQVLLENVDLYHSAGLGVLAQFSRDIRLNHFKAVPNPVKQRILSGHDDGIHISNCRGLITIENCTFEALMDDPVNIHGTTVRVIEKMAADRLLCKFMHHQSVGLEWTRAGDTIGFIENESMVTVGQGVVKSFKTRDTELFEVSFTNEIPDAIQPGDALENLTWTPDVLVRKNHFGNNRARGILISTPGRVVVEDNTFTSSGSAILIAGDANYWFESGAVRDVLIRNNVFEETCLTSLYQFCEAIISIFPEIPEPGRNLAAFHRNIRIEQNEFHPFDFPVLFAKSVDGLVFSRNRIRRSRKFEPFHPRKQAFSFEFCRNVRVEKNIFEGDVLGKNISASEMNPGELYADPAQNLKLNN